MAICPASVAGTAPPLSGDLLAHSKQYHVSPLACIKKPTPQGVVVISKFSINHGNLPSLSGWHWPGRGLGGGASAATQGGRGSQGTGSPGSRQKLGEIGRFQDFFQRSKGFVGSLSCSMSNFPCFSFQGNCFWHALNNDFGMGISPHNSGWNSNMGYQTNKTSHTAMGISRGYHGIISECVCGFVSKNNQFEWGFQHRICGCPLLGHIDLDFPDGMGGLGMFGMGMGQQCSDFTPNQSGANLVSGSQN